MICINKYCRHVITTHISLCDPCYNHNMTLNPVQTIDDIFDFYMCQLLSIKPQPKAKAMPHPNISVTYANTTPLTAFLEKYELNINIKESNDNTYFTSIIESITFKSRGSTNIIPGGTGDSPISSLNSLVTQINEYELMTITPTQSSGSKEYRVPRIIQNITLL